MQAMIGSVPVGATWTQTTGGGILLPNGAYTASSSGVDGGSTLVSGSFHGVSEQALIAVTGGFPGLVNRIYDYLASAQIQRVTDLLP